MHFMGVLWETADFICTNPECGRVTDGYGNYVSRLTKDEKRLNAMDKMLESDSGTVPYAENGEWHVTYLDNGAGGFGGGVMDGKFNNIREAIDFATLKGLK